MVSGGGLKAGGVVDHFVAKVVDKFLLPPAFARTYTPACNFSRNIPVMGQCAPVPNPRLSPQPLPIITLLLPVPTTPLSIHHYPKLYSLCTQGNLHLSECNFVISLSPTFYLPGLGGAPSKYCDSSARSWGPPRGSACVAPFVPI